jgi:hypothetical protein
MDEATNGGGGLRNLRGCAVSDLCGVVESSLCDEHLDCPHQVLRVCEPVCHVDEFGYCIVGSPSLDVDPGK